MLIDWGQIIFHYNFRDVNFIRKAVGVEYDPLN